MGGWKIFQKLIIGGTIIRYTRVLTYYIILYFVLLFLFLRINTSYAQFIISVLSSPSYANELSTLYDSSIVL